VQDAGGVLDDLCRRPERVRSWSRASSARAVARLDYATRDRFITGHVTDVFEWVGE